MREIVIDTETTGLDFRSGDRIIEVGCVELKNFIPTGKTLQFYCKPDKLIYIGDRLEVDAVASSDAGMLGIWINRKRRLEKKLPKSIVEIYSLTQLSQIIK